MGRSIYCTGPYGFITIGRHIIDKLKHNKIQISEKLSLLVPS